MEGTSDGAFDGHRVLLEGCCDVEGAEDVDGFSLGPSVG